MGVNALKILRGYDTWNMGTCPFVLPFSCLPCDFVAVIAGPNALMDPCRSNIGVVRTPAALMPIQYDTIEATMTAVQDSVGQSRIGA